MEKIKRLERRVPHWTEEVPRETALELAQRRFTKHGWQYLQDRFDVLNKQFFDGQLPKPIIIAGLTSDRVDGTCFGLIIFVSNQDLFTQELILLHEMNHMRNAIYNTHDADHGKGWAESLKDIHKLLNIDIDPHSLTTVELERWPMNMFANYGLMSYFKRSFYENDNLRSLPTGWNLERSPPAKQQTDKNVICKGDPVSDLKVLQEQFGLEYIENLTRRKHAI